MFYYSVEAVREGTTSIRQKFLQNQKGSSTSQGNRMYKTLCLMTIIFHIINTLRH